MLDNSCRIDTGTNKNTIYAILFYHWIPHVFSKYDRSFTRRIRTETSNWMAKKIATRNKILLKNAIDWSRLLLDIS